MHYAKTIAIDGTAGSGKSTIGARLAEKLGYVFVDAGTFYRTITALALAHQADIYDESAVMQFANPLSTSRLDDLHTDAINRAVPIVAAYPQVRAQVRKVQQEIARQEGIVFAGRDIGTVVLPHADLKIFLNPSLEERATRRHAANPQRSFDQLVCDLEQRDSLDATRHDSPLRIAEDAIVVNTDGMAVTEVLDLLMEFAHREE